MLSAIFICSVNVALATNTSTHTSLVQTDSIDMPDVLDGRVEAVAVVGSRVIVGGTFTQVQGLDGTVYDQPYLFAFDQGTGIFDAAFDPILNRPVLALASSRDNQSVFVGGSFTTVNGQKNRKGFTKLRLNGDRTSNFAGRTNGVVKDMIVDEDIVYIVGRFTKVGATLVEHFAAVDGTTGQALPAVNSVFAGEYSTSVVKGSLSVDDIDLTPDGATAVIVGNFSSIDGQARSRLAVFDLSGPVATLSSWNTAVYAVDCPSTRFPQYIKGLDVSPDGSYFVTGSSGFWEVGEPACDTVVRFELDSTDSNVQPTWFAHTGGDSVYEVAISGEAVYAGGHFRRFNNEFSADGNNVAGRGSVTRLGMVALDPLNGLPLDWRADRSPRGVGTFELLVDDGGLWIGDDTEFINGKFHGRLKYLPLDTEETVDRSERTALPTTLFRTNRSTGSLQALSFDGANLGTPINLSSAGWDVASGAVVLGRQLFYGSTDTSVYSLPISSDSVGTRLTVDLNGLTSDEFPIDQIGGMYFDHDRGRLYYTIMDDSRLFFRHFTPATPIFGDRQFEIADPAAVPWADVRGMDRIADQLYFGHRDGYLYRVTMDEAVPVSGTTIAISGPAIDGQNWANGALAFFADGEFTLPSTPVSTILSPTKSEMLKASEVTAISGQAFSDAGINRVDVALRNTDTGDWLHSDGTYGKFQWLDTTLDEPGQTRTDWHLNVQLPVGPWSILARARDQNGVLQEDRPSTRFLVNHWASLNDGLSNVGIASAGIGTDGSFWGANLSAFAYRRAGINGDWQSIAANVPNAKLIHVDAQRFDQALATDTEGRIYKYNGTSWAAIPGTLVYPSIGADGSMWGVNQFGWVYRRSSSANAWTRIPGPSMAKVDALNLETAVAIDRNGQVYHFEGTAWQTVQAEPMTAISYGNDGSLWGINMKSEAVRALSAGNPWEVFFAGFPLTDIDAQDYYRALGITDKQRVFLASEPNAAGPKDTQAPTVNIVSPNDGSVSTASTLNLVAQSTDNVGVTGAGVAIQDISTGLWLAPGNGALSPTRQFFAASVTLIDVTTANITFDMSLNPGGSYRAIIIAGDDAGNLSAEATVTFETAQAVVPAGNVVMNGSFEDVAWSGATHTSPTGWVLGGTALAGGLHRNPARATDGSQYVVFGGWGTRVGASLSQQVAVKVGTRYRLTYDLRATRSDQTVRVEVFDQVGDIIYSDDTTTTAGQLNRFSHEFDATADTVTLRFTHTDGAGGDADFDNVKLVQSLVANGSFENVLWSGARHEQPANWVLGGKPLSGGLHRNVLRATDGQQYMVFGGWGATTGASLSQTVPVIPGQDYSILYDLSSAWGTSEQTVRVEVFVLGGGLLMSSDSSVQTSDIRSFEHEFTATSDAVIVNFTHTQGTLGDADFDNVRVYER